MKGPLLRGLSVRAAAGVLAAAAAAASVQFGALGRRGYRTDLSNDPSRRLMVVANYDNDVPEYWEWSGQGLFPFDTSNEAYKLGVNSLIYGMTH